MEESLPLYTNVQLIGGSYTGYTSSGLSEQIFRAGAVGKVLFRNSEGDYVVRFSEMNEFVCESVSQEHLRVFVPGSLQQLNTTQRNFALEIVQWQRTAPPARQLQICA